MGELRGGTTIAGYTALHSGLKEAYLSGNLTVNGKINMAVGNTLGLFGKDSKPIVIDHDNGNVTLSATGGKLYIGYSASTLNATSTGVILSSNLYASNGTTLMADTAGKLYYSGQDADVRYVRMASDPYISTDQTGSTAYPRMVVKNGGGTDNNWIRVGTSSGYGFLPYSDGVGQLGTSSWKFSQVHGVTIYENGTALSSKYAASGHNHDSTYVNKTGDTMSGQLTVTGNQITIQGGSPTLKFNDTDTTTAGGGYFIHNNSGRLYFLQDSTGSGTWDGTHPGWIEPDRSLQWNWPVKTGGMLTVSSGHENLRLVGQDDTTPVSYLTFYNKSQTSRLGFIGVGSTADNDVNIRADNGNVTISSSGNKVVLESSYPIELGGVKYWNGTRAGGDGIFGPGTLNVGSGTGSLNLWSEAGGIFLKTGAVGSAKNAIGITNAGRVYRYTNRHGSAEEMSSYWDSTNDGETTYKSITTSGWHTIAYNGDSNSAITSGGDRAMATFTVLDAASGRHEAVQFIAATAFNRGDACNIRLLAQAKYGTTSEIIGGIRILTGSTYATQFLQVYLTSGCVVKCVMESNHWQKGWTPVNFALMSSIPSGWVDNKLEMQGGTANRPQNLFSGTGSPPSQGAFPGDVYIQY
jgi:hypothetical protein